MKKICVLFLLGCISACNQPSAETRELRAEIEKLRQQVQESYKPGLGEMMNGIQLHHEKLWFAGVNANWPLADFELHEIGETLDDIRKYNADRPEIKSLGMIEPALDSLRGAVEQRDQGAFRRDFQLLTQNCNQCHQNTDHGFNTIVEPVSPRFGNQSFKPFK